MCVRVHARMRVQMRSRLCTHDERFICAPAIQNKPPCVGPSPNPGYPWWGGTASPRPGARAKAAISTHPQSKSSRDRSGAHLRCRCSTPRATAPGGSSFTTSPVSCGDGRGARVRRTHGRAHAPRMGVRVPQAQACASRGHGHARNGAHAQLGACADRKHNSSDCDSPPPNPGPHAPDSTWARRCFRAPLTMFVTSTWKHSS